MQQMMDEVFVGPVNVETISQLERATTEAIAAPVEEAQTAVHAHTMALSSGRSVKPTRAVKSVVSRANGPQTWIGLIKCSLTS